MPAMAASAAGAAQVQTPASGGNPFQIVTNLYAEKNNQGILPNTLMTAARVDFGGAINAGNYLRGLRLLLRTPVAGVAGSFLASATVWDFLRSLTLTNVDGSEILYNMSALSHYLCHKYFRPWLQDPENAYDYTSSAITPSYTLPLFPEVRWSAGVLANTDTRSQYRFAAQLAATTDVGSGYTTAPTINVTPYMDAWAQPDAQDLQGQANQPVPPGVNLQVKRRHQIFTLNAANSNNVFLSTLTGNALRGAIILTRDGNNAFQDALSDPIYWTIDNRSLGRLGNDIIKQWMEDFYADYGRSTRRTGVLVFPRFLSPGNLYGQGWLYTANNTKLQWETATANGITGTGTMELITDEVYPVGPVDPQLVDI